MLEPNGGGTIWSSQIQCLEWWTVINHPLHNCTKVVGTWALVFVVLEAHTQKTVPSIPVVAHRPMGPCQLKWLVVTWTLTAAIQWHLLSIITDWTPSTAGNRTCELRHFTNFSRRKNTCLLNFHSKGTFIIVNISWSTLLHYLQIFHRIIFVLCTEKCATKHLDGEKCSLETWKDVQRNAFWLYLKLFINSTLPWHSLSCMNLI